MLHVCSYFESDFFSMTTKQTHRHTHTPSHTHLLTSMCQNGSRSQTTHEGEGIYSTCIGPKSDKLFSYSWTGDAGDVRNEFHTLRTEYICCVMYKECVLRNACCCLHGWFEANTRCSVAHPSAPYTALYLSVKSPLQKQAQPQRDPEGGTGVGWTQHLHKNFVVLNS